MYKKDEIKFVDDVESVVGESVATSAIRLKMLRQIVKSGSIGTYDSLSKKWIE